MIDQKHSRQGEWHEQKCRGRGQLIREQWGIDIAELVKSEVYHMGFKCYSKVEDCIFQKMGSHWRFFVFVFFLPKCVSNYLWHYARWRYTRITQRHIPDFPIQMHHQGYYICRNKNKNNNNKKKQIRGKKQVWIIGKESLNYMF